MHDICVAQLSTLDSKLSDIEFSSRLLLLTSLSCFDTDTCASMLSSMRWF